MSDSHLPCRAHALLWTVRFFSWSWHSTAVERRPVGYLPVFGFFWLPNGVPRRLLSEAYKFSSQRSIPTTVKSGSSTLQKRQSVKLLDYQFGYFRPPRRISRRTRHCRSRAGARHGMCELTNGMAGERHGRGMDTACYVWIGLYAFSWTVYRPVHKAEHSSSANLEVENDHILTPLVRTSAWREQGQI